MKNDYALSTEKETRNGYHISSEMKKVWKEEIGILCELDRVCKELGIKYFLDSGTLLGAVRDGHFIPWDDDIDVIMLRESYDVLVENADKYFNEDFFFQCAYTDVDYPRGHAQLRKKNTCAMIPYEAHHVRFDQSIFIDIFVLDGVAPDEDKLKDQFRRKSKIKRKIDIIGIPASTKPINTLIKKMLRIMYKLGKADMKQLFREYESICKEYNNSEYIDKIMFRDFPEQVYHIKREWFKEAVDVMFEGLPFPAPVGYDHVLKTYFGDNYMIPAKAPTMHGGLIIHTDKSYKDVLRGMD